MTKRKYEKGIAKPFKAMDFFMLRTPLYPVVEHEFIKQDKNIIKKQTIASFIFEILDQIVGGVFYF